MHQPAPLPDEVGMGLSDGEIVHKLRLPDNLHPLDDPVATGLLPHPVSNLQVTGRDLGQLVGEEGVVRGGLDGLTVDGQIDEGLVEMGPNGRDGMPAELAGRFVVGPDHFSQPQVANRPETGTGQHRGFGAEAAKRAQEVVKGPSDKTERTPGVVQMPELSNVT